MSNLPQSRRSQERERREIGALQGVKGAGRELLHPRPVQRGKTAKEKDPARESQRRGGTLLKEGGL